MKAKRVRIGALLASLTTAAAYGQTSGIITARPVCVPPNGAQDTINYVQGPDPILLPGGDVAILVDVGHCCVGHWEGIFSLVYPGANTIATPRFNGIWATDNFETEHARGEDEAPFPSAILYGGRWRIAYTSTFRPHDWDNRDRVARLDLPNLTYRATTSQVTNQWIKPIPVECRKLNSCGEVRGSGILGTFVLHPNGELYVYHPDGTYLASCESGWVRHKINSNTSVANPTGDGCITLTGEGQAPTWLSDIARGPDGNLYMLTTPVSGTMIEEWMSTGDAATIGLVWNRTGRTWLAPPHPNPPTVYGVRDAGYLKDPNRQIVVPKVVVSSISSGVTWEEITDASLGRYYLYYWADAGAPLPPGFGGPASSCAFGGTHEAANCAAVTGWAWDPSFPNSPISVEIYDGVALIATVPANIYRPDLENAGKGNGVHGFSWTVPDNLKNNQAHSISVKYNGSETRLQGSPKTINCAPPTFSLNVTKAGTGSGTVSSNPAGITCGSDCSQSYNLGTFVVLTATPAVGSSFAGWGGDADCSDGSVTMSAPHSCTVAFNLNGNALTVGRAGTGAGTVTSSPPGINCGSDCTETYAPGTVVTLTPTPAAGSTFTSWSGDADCLDGNLTMTIARSCTAMFNASAGNTLTVTRAGTGSGTVTSNPAGINCGSDCAESYAVGAVVNLTATAAAGSTFAAWGGDADCSDGSVTMNAGRSCTANFNSSATAHLIWIQPQHLAGFGPPGSLIVAGSASGAPAGTGVVMTWRNLSTAGPWTTEPYAPGPDASGIWLNQIMNANDLQLYEVYVAYGGYTSPHCTYQGGDVVTWCP